jgi:hypothetical protein
MTVKNIDTVEIYIRSQFEEISVAYSQLQPINWLLGIEKNVFMKTNEEKKKVTK